MDIAQLVLKFVETLVWPALVVSFLLIFRSQIRALLARIQSAKVLGVEAVFDSASRVLSDPDSTDEQKSVAIKIAQDVAADVSNGPDEIIDGLRYEQLVQVALQGVVRDKAQVVKLKSDGPFDLIVYPVDEAIEPFVVVLKISVQSMSSTIQDLQRNGGNRALVVLRKSPRVQFGHRMEAPGFVFVLWSSPKDDSKLKSALQELGMK